MQYSTIGLSLVLKRNPANVIFGIWKNGFWINSHTGIRNISYLEPRQNTKIVPLPVAKYGGRYNVTMMPGDGIGPEMMGYVQQVFRYAGVPVDFEQVLLNSTTNSTEDDFKNALITIKRNGVALKGSIESKYGDLSSTLSRNAIMRTELDLFANVIHCRSYPGIVNRHNNIDILLIRQNTEGEYSLMEHENVPGVVESLKIVTRAASERLARYAFDYARTHSRKKVTIVHKANIMKLSDGLFLESCKQISKEFPELEVDNMIIDNTCMQLVAKPSQFDVMVMPNLYGTVVTNLVCGLVGGPGLLSGCNYGDKFAVFEPGTRNTGTSVAGRNIANPTAMLNSSCDLLDHLDLDHHAGMIRRAVNQTINIDKIHTPDIGGQASSIDVVQNIIKCLQAETAVKNCPLPTCMKFGFKHF